VLPRSELRDIHVVIGDDGDRLASNQCAAGIDRCAVLHARVADGHGIVGLGRRHCRSIRAQLDAATKIQAATIAVQTPHAANARIRSSGGWGHKARLSEVGVLWDRRLLRWSQVNPSWDSEREILTFIGPDQHGINLEFEVIVPESVRDSVASIVDGHIRIKTVPNNVSAD
jgi:hypothetical protein